MITSHRRGAANCCANRCIGAYFQSFQPIAAGLKLKAFSPLLFGQTVATSTRLIDTSVISRHGKSSGELRFSDDFETRVTGTASENGSRDKIHHMNNNKL